MVHHDQYYAEESFGGLQNTGRIYTGPLLGLGVASILACFGMSSITKVMHLKCTMDSTT